MGHAALPREGALPAPLSCRRSRPPPTAPTFVARALVGRQEAEKKTGVRAPAFLTVAHLNTPGNARFPSAAPGKTTEVVRLQLGKVRAKAGLRLCPASRRHPPPPGGPGRTNGLTAETPRVAVQAMAQVPPALDRPPMPCGLGPRRDKAYSGALGVDVPVFSASSDPVVAEEAAISASD